MTGWLSAMPTTRPLGGAQNAASADPTKLAEHVGGDAYTVELYYSLRYGFIHRKLPWIPQVFARLWKRPALPVSQCSRIPSNHGGTASALAGGVDVPAHTIPMEEGFTPEEPARMKAQHVGLIPTISLFPDVERRFGGSKEDEQALTNKAIAQLKSYFDIGGTILFGTDVGCTQVYDTTSEFRIHDFWSRGIFQGVKQGPNRKRNGCGCGCTRR
jgi:hypothetical protein